MFAKYATHALQNACRCHQYELAKSAEPWPFEDVSRSIAQALSDECTEPAKAEVERLGGIARNYLAAADRYKAALEKIVGFDRTHGYPTGVEWLVITAEIREALGQGPIKK